MNEVPEPPEFMRREFLVSMLRNAFEFDARAAAVRDDPRALRALLDECLGPEVRMQPLDRSTAMDKLYRVVLDYEPGDSKGLYDACRDSLSEMVAQQAKHQVNTILHEQMQLPEDFDDRALSLRADPDALRRFLAETLLPMAPPDWSDETRAAVIDRQCKAVLDHDADGSTPLIVDCMRSLRDVYDQTGQPLVRVQRIHHRVAGIGGSPTSSPLSPA